MEKQAAEKLANKFAEYLLPHFVKECEARGMTFRNDEELKAAFETAGLIQTVKQAMIQNGQLPANPKTEKRASQTKKADFFRANRLIKEVLSR